MTDPAWPGVVMAVKAIAMNLKRNGQNLLFETGQETPVVLLRLFETVGTGNLYVNLDPANLILYGKGNPVDSLDVFCFDGSLTIEREISGEQQIKDILETKKYLEDLIAQL